MNFSQIRFKVEIEFPTIEFLNATRQEDDACMHDFGFSKQNIYHFQKVFDFSDFSKI